jgi:aminopeptidase YwaD
MAKIEISDEHVKKSIQLTKDIIEKCGPRLAGSESSREAAKIIHTELEKYCDSVHFHRFHFHPRAFFGHVELIPILYVLSTFLLFFRVFYAAWIGFLFLIFVFTIQFVYYKRFLDPLYTKAEGLNVIGTLEPAAEVKQQIILSAHHDSARIFRLLALNAQMYVIIIIGAVVTGFLVASALTFIVAVHIFTGRVSPFIEILRYVVPGASIFFLPLFFFLSSEVTVGAGDNLIASSMLVTLAEVFEKSRGTKERLNHTRLKFISFDAEEAGVRGSKVYTRAYKKELTRLPTYNLNLDSIFDVKQIKFLTRDINGTVKLSRQVAKECLAVAQTLGYNARLFGLILGMGGTDAAEMARVGVKATSLVAMRTDFFQKKVMYHTREDTPENLDRKAVKAVLKIVSAVVLKKEEEVTPGLRSRFSLKNMIGTLFWYFKRKIFKSG